MNKASLARAVVAVAMFGPPVGASFGAAPAVHRRPRLADPRPNVILIYADDLGYGDVSCFRGAATSPGTAGAVVMPDWETPALDRLAAAGARLTSFYTTCPLCAPSRASLLTGRYQFRSGLMENPCPDVGKNDMRLPAGEITLAEALGAVGYRSACIGKWHLGHRPDALPTTQGFDEYFGIPYSNDMRPVQLLDGTRVVEEPVVQATLTRRYTERAIGFIERARHWPFLLYLPGVMPHKPLAPSEDFYTPETPDDLYGDVIRELDWGVGEILRALDRLGLAVRTLVIFSSDNGPWFGGSAGPFRGMKGTAFEGGYRVPMIARLPGVIPAGLVSGEMASTIDLFPTILDLCGASLPADRPIDGRDILPLLTRPGARSPHDALFCLSARGLLTVRDRRWKLHLVKPNTHLVRSDPAKPWRDPRAPDGVTILAPFEQVGPDRYPGVSLGEEPRAGMLFNLENDPGEQRDVAAAQPEAVRRLRALAAGIEAQMPGGTRPDDPGPGVRTPEKP